jgi:hypothetical protein
MDSTVWKFYVEKQLNFEINEPAVLLVDNFDCHVSEEGQRLVAEEANARVVPLPPNSTAICQPLDVGVMGPLKANMRNILVEQRVGAQMKNVSVLSIQRLTTNPRLKCSLPGR